MRQAADFTVCSRSRSFSRQRLRHEAAQVEAGLGRANAEANRSAADEATEATIRRLEHQAQSLQAALHAIETSRTWRLSEPLRRWGTRVKQIAGKLERG